MPVLYNSPAPPVSPEGVSSYVLSSATFSSAGLVTWLCGALVLLMLIIGVRSIRAGYSSRGVSKMSHPSLPAISQSQSLSAQPQPYREGSEKQPQPQPLEQTPRIARGSSSATSFTTPAATAAEGAKSWPPPPPMPTISPLELPDYSQFPYPYRPRDSRDEYYFQSPDQYPLQPQGQSQGQGQGQEGLKSPYQSQYQYYYGYPAHSPPSVYTSHYPPPQTSVLPPPHPDASNPPLPSSRNPRTHRRSYSQKVIYPKPLSSPSDQPWNSSVSAPDLTRDNIDFSTASESPTTTTATMGIEVAEEVIIAAEGWRRHTRVYGGGVCMACLESEAEQKMVFGGQGPMLVEEPVEDAEGAATSTTRPLNEIFQPAAPERDPERKDDDEKQEADAAVTETETAALVKDDQGEKELEDLRRKDSWRATKEKERDI